MSNQIVTQRFIPDNQGNFCVSGVFWLAVPAANVVPAPAFQSAVPFVDQVTLGQLRAGTIVEQPFQSQSFPLPPAALSGTATTTNGSPNVTFSVAQNLAAGVLLTFSNQPGTSYTLLNAVSGLAGTLTANYTGTGGSGQTVTAGNSTTTVASVQSAIQAQFATAQAAVTAGAAPLSGLLGSIYNGSAWSQVASGLVVFDPAKSLVTDVRWAAASGLVPGLVTSRATGYVQTSAVASVPVMATTYNPQGTNAQRSVVSSSAADSAAGTGAQQVLFTYLDAAFAVHQELVTLNGVTPVNTVGVNWAYLESIQVVQVGSGKTNAGTISVYTAVAGGGTVWGSVAVDGSNQSNWCHHYVPAGVTCYVLSVDGFAFATIGTVYLMRTGNPSAANLPLTQLGGSVGHGVADRQEHKFSTALAVQGPDRIVLYTRPQATTADTTEGNFEYIQC